MQGEKERETEGGSQFAGFFSGSQLSIKKTKVFPSHKGPWGGADLSFYNP